MAHEGNHIISEAMTTIARWLTARFSYLVAMPRYCLSLLTHLSTTLRLR